MNTFMRHRRSPQTPGQPSTQELLRVFVATERRVESLPELSAPERVSFDQAVALSHLYYSSKIEGTRIKKEQLEEVVKPAA